ncbi:MAG TPA: hypothetical protein VIR45_10085, partial [Kiloniellaceae bacterium]
LLASPIARLSSINFNYLAPFMIMLIMFAAFQSQKAWGDLYAVVLLGIMAFYMRRYGYSRPALVVGYVLANGIETNLYQTVNFYGLDVFTRPIFLVLLALAVLCVYFGMKLIKSQKLEAELTDMPLGAGQLAFLGFIAVFAAGIFIFSMDLLFLSRILPMTLGTVTLLVAAALLYHMLRKTDGPNAARFDDELIGENASKAPPEHQLLWFLGLIGAGMVVGFFLAIGLFLVTFLKVRTELSNRTIAIMTACGLGVLAFVGYVLRLNYPAGVLQYWFDLPWPLA